MSLYLRRTGRQVAISMALACVGEEPATEDELLALLKPCADEVLKIWPVGKMVGNVWDEASPALRRQRSEVRIFSGAPRFQ
jgi:hypothetical protein